MKSCVRKWKELPGDISTAHRVLVAALREVRECSPRTQTAIARDAVLAATTLSNHLNGGRIPEERLLRDLYKVMEEDANANGLLVPYTLDSLLELRSHALKKHCRCCTVGYPPAEADEPATQTARSRFRSRRLRMRLAHRREIKALSAQMKVPVPRQEGDRHLAETAVITWAELGVVTHYLAEGRNRDADIMLWRAGASFSADEVLSVVASCRAAGLEDAAETVLITAAEREDKQAVLNISAAFQQAGRHEDVALILAAAARDTG